MTVDELVRGVNIALGNMPPANCPQFDSNGDDRVTVDELVRGVNAALNGCSGTVTATATSLPRTTPTPTPSATVTPLPPSPTATERSDPDALLAMIQATIFTPTCAVRFCHSSITRIGGLVLEDGLAQDHLVGVSPTNGAAKQAGLVRVAPGNIEGSFIIKKLEGPPPGMGSRMPFGQPPLSAEKIQLIRDWIEALPSSPAAAAIEAASTSNATHRSWPPTWVTRMSRTLTGSGFCRETHWESRLDTDLGQPRWALCG